MRAVVMGGTSGIGLAVAEALAADGAEVIVTGRDPGRLAAVTERVTAAERLDATAYDDVRGFFARIGELDHLVLAFSPGAVGMGRSARSRSTRRRGSRGSCSRTWSRSRPPG